LVTAAAPAVPHQPSAVAAATYACLTRQWLSGWPMSTRSFTGVRAQASQACGPVQEEANRRVPMGRTSILVRRRRSRPRIRHQLSPARRRPSCYTGGAPSAPARARRMERCGWTLRVRYGGTLGGRRPMLSDCTNPFALPYANQTKSFLGCPQFLLYTEDSNS
jgi:hypothetical protein